VVIQNNIKLKLLIYGRKIVSYKNGIKRICIVAFLFWAAIWTYIGWRGYSLIQDIYKFIDNQPAGAALPDSLFQTLQQAQTYVFRAVVWGAGVALVMAIGVWIYRGFSSRKRPERRG